MVISIDAEKIQKFINDKKQNGILKTKNLKQKSYLMVICWEILFWD